MSNKLKLFDLEGNQSKIVAVVDGDKSKVAVVEELLRNLQCVTGQTIRCMEFFPHIYKPDTKCHAVCIKIDDEGKWRFSMYANDHIAYPRDIKSGVALEVSFEALVSRLQGQVEIWRSGL